ncbi:MAG: hypothetical protein HLX52_01115 [Idiomarinaceae bacterium]|uniref:hypothetical protein n=1 Tax=Idiomarina sp. 28-8 TaxID=1260624 RepID=UPI00030AC329|nr:hypothetical protein [Idiomarina sp. 28-8]NWO01547.1 hypothetical protein [Idiomarinaceae bacterium]
MIGYSTVLLDGVKFRISQNGAFPLSPPFKAKCLEVSKVKLLLRDKRVSFARWETSFDENSETPWWHVVKSGGTDLESLSSNTRSKVRRGLKRFKCQPVSREIILLEGYQVYESAFSRYSTHERKFSYNEFLEAVKALPAETEFWEVRDLANDKLVSFSENFVESGACFYNTIWFEPNSLKRYSSYALFFEMNRYYLESRGFDYVSDGARSLSHDTQIHDFLESKFGFRKAYSTLNVIYAPWLKVLISCSYPFRYIIGKVPYKAFQKASILLKQEEISRQCQRVNV